MSIGAIASKTLVETSVKLVVDHLPDLARKARNGFSEKLSKSLIAYAESELASVSKTKTILYRQEAVPLSEFYIPIDLSDGGEVLASPGLRTVRSRAPRVLITGTAGCGKSTFMRHLSVDGIINAISLPIFFELRTLKDFKNPLDVALHEVLTRHKWAQKIDTTRTALKAGLFTVLLDGFDEVSSSLSGKMSDLLDDFCDSYPHTQVVVSSRPDSELLSWSSFTELWALPLSPTKSTQLIEKLRYDPSVKKRFISSLEKGEFSKHESFLSNPLLLTIMLMTFSRNASIPNKSHLFYSQVYETLFHRHDATKKVYARQMYANLAIDDFQRVISTFSIASLLKQKTEFTKTEAITLLRAGERLLDVEYSPEAVLRDMLKSVCILSEDGLDLVYTHKTFQEYFAALFIQQTSEPEKTKLLNAVGSRFGETVRILHELDPQTVELKLILPVLEWMSSNLAVPSDPKNWKFTQAVKTFCSTIRVVGDFAKLTYADQRIVPLLRFSRRAFPDLFQNGPLVTASSRRRLAAVCRRHFGATRPLTIPIKQIDDLNDLRDAVIECLPFTPDDIAALFNLLARCRDRKRAGGVTLQSLNEIASASLGEA